MTTETKNEKDSTAGTIHEKTGEHFNGWAMTLKFLGWCGVVLAFFGMIMEMIPKADGGWILVAAGLTMAFHWFCLAALFDQITRIQKTLEPVYDQKGKGS